MLVQSSGTQVLHASAVLMGRGVVAFCAQSGTGKSTLAFALHRRGHALWADDAVAFRISTAGAVSIPLPFAVRLRPDPSRPFATTEIPSTSMFDRDAAAPLVALFALERVLATRGVEVDLLPPSRAFPAALTHAYCFSLQNPDRKAQMVGQYLELVAKVPLFAIRFGTGFEHIEPVLDAIERRVDQLSTVVS